MDMETETLVYNHLENVLPKDYYFISIGKMYLIVTPADEAGTIDGGTIDEIIEVCHFYGAEYTAVMKDGKIAIVID